MTWTVDKIEQQLLSGEIDSIVFPALDVVNAVNRAERMLGKEWIEAQTRNQKGLAPAMRIIGTGLRLRTVESLSGNKELIGKLRKEDTSADAELTAIHLLCSRSSEIEVQLFPSVGNRVADFRVRRGPEEWTIVEVAGRLIAFHSIMLDTPALRGE